jgi:putative nucleotidyltransferase with HDIG domain
MKEPSMSQEFGALLKRETQLNQLSWIIIVSLLVLVGFLTFVLVSQVELTDLWLLRNQFVQVLIPGLLLMVILYMADAHRRTRERLSNTHRELEGAREGLIAAYDRVLFVHDVATQVSDLKRNDVMPSVLRESVMHYEADAAAVVSGEDVEVFAEDPLKEAAARNAAMAVAMQTVRTGEPATHEGQDGSWAIGVPIRVKGILDSVAVLWRQERTFSEDEIGHLKLLARVLELGTENKKLVTELRQQLRGSLGLLTTLIEDRQKDYAGHSQNVANLAVSVGRRMGLIGQPMEDLKLAGLVHDLGMLRVPSHLLALDRDPTEQERAQLRSHPEIGAHLARAAGLRPAVQESIQAHHEHVDGSGYPAGLKGSRIPLAARIIAVCDSYDAVTHGRPGKRPLSPVEALEWIARQAGKRFDREVVGAFEHTMSEQLELAALSGLAGVPAGMEGVPQPVNGLHVA